MPIVEIVKPEREPLDYGDLVYVIPKGCLGRSFVGVICYSQTAEDHKGIRSLEDFSVDGWFWSIPSTEYTVQKLPRGTKVLLEQQ